LLVLGMVEGMVMGLGRGDELLLGALGGPRIYWVCTKMH
jgi:hypothetical protein